MNLITGEALCDYEINSRRENVGFFLLCFHGYYIIFRIIIENTTHTHQKEANVKKQRYLKVFGHLTSNNLTKYDYNSRSKVAKL